MAGHDAFISYSSHDKVKADAVCAILEREGIRCWIAPRDIVPGRTWGGSIVDAIRASRAVILVFSESTNRSEQVIREVERAVRHSIPIIPFRIEKAEPTGDMEFFMGVQHWLDAIDPPLERHIVKLAEVVRRLLGTGAAEPTVGDDTTLPERGRAGTRSAGAPKRVAPVPRAVEDPPHEPPSDPAGPSPSGKRDVPVPTLTDPIPTRKMLAIGGAVAGALLLLLLVAVVGFLVFRDDEEDPDPGTATVEVDPGPSAGTTPPPATGSTTSHVLAAGLDAVHAITVPPGQSRTVEVFSQDFDPVVEVWRQTRRVDSYTTLPETVDLTEPGDWVVTVESYDTRAGAYEHTSGPTGLSPIIATSTIASGNRRPHTITVAPGQTWRFTAQSADFDPVLKVFRMARRVDAHVSGTAEEVGLFEAGEWELIVKSYDTRVGTYTLSIR